MTCIRGMTRLRRFTFAFVTSVSKIWKLSELYFLDFCVVFSWVRTNNLDDPLLFEASIVTLEDTICSLRFLLLNVLPVRECSVLVDTSTPLMDLRVEEVSFMNS